VGLPNKTHWVFLAVCLAVSALIKTVISAQSTSLMLSLGSCVGDSRAVFVCRLVKDGSLWYLVKWRDLPYDQATWEAEDAVIPELSKHIEEYYCLR